MIQMIVMPEFFLPYLLSNALNADLYAGKPGLNQIQPSEEETK